jgi:polar amino acid transport system substrate-binding protein
MKLIISPLFALAIAFGTLPVVSAEQPTANSVAQSSDLQSSEQGLAIYTENYPPLNYEEFGEARGLSVDLLLEMFARAKIDKERHNIMVAPWERGFDETQTRPNTILFSTVRTPARENLFKWVGPIGVSRVVLVARRDRDVNVENGAAFNKYRYGVVKHSLGDEALKQGGTSPDQLIYLNSPLSAAHMLARGRVDAWAFERMVSFWVLQKLGYRAQDFKIIHAFEKRQYYFALQKDSDPALIAKLQKALDEIRADGTMAAIVEGHIPGASMSFLEQLDQ